MYIYVYMSHVEAMYVHVVCIFICSLAMYIYIYVYIYVYIYICYACCMQTYAKLNHHMYHQQKEETSLTKSNFIMTDPHHNMWTSCKIRGCWTLNPWNLRQKPETFRSFVFFWGGFRWSTNKHNIIYPYVVSNSCRSIVG